MERKANTGAKVTILVSLVAMLAIGATFMANASPYVDIAQAKTTEGNNLHLLGQIDKSSVHADALARSIQFDLTDAKGAKIHVNYSGEAIANIDEADKVVAVGAVNHDQFLSHKLFIKCPSKYGDKKAAGTAAS